MRGRSSEADSHHQLLQWDMQAVPVPLQQQAPKAVPDTQEGQEERLRKMGLLTKNTFLELATEMGGQIPDNDSRAGSDPTTTSSSRETSLGEGDTRPPPGLTRESSKKVWTEYQAKERHSGAKANQQRAELEAQFQAFGNTGPQMTNWNQKVGEIKWIETQAPGIEWGSRREEQQESLRSYQESSQSSGFYHRAAEDQAQRLAENVLDKSEGDDSTSRTSGRSSQKPRESGTSGFIPSESSNRLLGYGGGASSSSAQPAAVSSRGDVGRPIQPGPVQPGPLQPGPLQPGPVLKVGCQPDAPHGPPGAQPGAIATVRYPASPAAAAALLGPENAERLRQRAISRAVDFDEAVMKVPLDEEGRLTSLGSGLHVQGACKPCAFAFAVGGTVSLGSFLVSPDFMHSEGGEAGGVGSSGVRGSTAAPSEAGDGASTLGGEDGREKVGCLEGVLCRFCHFMHPAVSKIRLRPCKGKRERYRKLVNKLASRIDEDPEGFNAAELPIPASISDNPMLQARLLARLADHAEQAKTARQDRDSGRESGRESGTDGEGSRGPPPPVFAPFGPAANAPSDRRPAPSRSPPPAYGGYPAPVSAQARGRPGAPTSGQPVIMRLSL
mmetsp:Transcript_3648/g.13405  ORF Transcript_3648/g.13405 Transcript_3648/m.13405 type:complete len:611 (+) Transcript_3648:57-1889(+)